MQSKMPDLADLSFQINYSAPVAAKIRIDYSYNTYDEMQNVFYAVYVGKVGLDDGESPLMIFVPKV